MVSVTPDELRGWLDVLEPDRRAHSLEVGRKVQSVQTLVGQGLREDLVTAGTLHDIGYGYPDTGFHPLDGARLLAREGFSPVVCSLVLRHSASMIEAEERGIDLAVYGDFAVNDDLAAAHQLVWWADMTTGPTGETVTVEDRLDEIATRYGPEDLVTRFIRRARPILMASCQAPGGSIQVSA
ncbi:HD domain-containing protein [uncultured Friedmanniella sp.]|uniref:HD domain-containing protein n=1 Tax=uncultured Friedmanniella sp. TaxID=335381 RepID=UPI0035CB65C1